MEYALAQDSDYLNLGLADERGDITQRMNTDKNDTDSIEEQSGQVQLEGSMTDPRISNDLSSFKPKRRIKVPKKLIGVDVKEEDEEGKKKREVGDTVEPITKKERTRKPREKKERTRKPKEKKERTRKPREKKQKEMKDIERKPREKKQREKDMERKEMEMKLSEY